MEAPPTSMTCSNKEATESSTRFPSAPKYCMMPHIAPIPTANVSFLVEIPTCTLYLCIGCYAALREQEKHCLNDAEAKLWEQVIGTTDDDPQYLHALQVLFSSCKDVAAATRHALRLDWECHQTTDLDWKVVKQRTTTSWRQWKQQMENHLKELEGSSNKRSCCRKTVTFSLPPNDKSVKEEEEEEEAKMLPSSSSSSTRSAAKNEEEEEEEETTL